MSECLLYAWKEFYAIACPWKFYAVRKVTPFTREGASIHSGNKPQWHHHPYKFNWQCNQPSLRVSPLISPRLPLCSLLVERQRLPQGFKATSIDATPGLTVSGSWILQCIDSYGPIWDVGSQLSKWKRQDFESTTACGCPSPCPKRKRESCQLSYGSVQEK